MHCQIGLERERNGKKDSVCLKLLKVWKVFGEVGTRKLLQLTCHIILRGVLSGACVRACVRYGLVIIYSLIIHESPPLTVFTHCIGKLYQDGMPNMAQMPALG